MKSAFQQLLETAEPASLGPETRPSRKSIAEIDKSLAPLFASAKSSPRENELVRALVLFGTITWMSRTKSPSKSTARTAVDPRHHAPPRAGFRQREILVPSRWPTCGISRIARRAGEMADRTLKRNCFKKSARAASGTRSHLWTRASGPGGAPETGAFLQRLQAAEFSVLLDYLTASA